MQLDILSQIIDAYHDFVFHSEHSAEEREPAGPANRRRFVNEAPDDALPVVDSAVEAADIHPFSTS